MFYSARKFYRIFLPTEENFQVNSADFLGVTKNLGISQQKCKVGATEVKITSQHSKFFGVTKSKIWYGNKINFGVWRKYPIPLSNRCEVLFSGPELK